MCCGLQLLLAVGRNDTRAGSSSILNSSTYRRYAQLGAASRRRLARGSHQ
jgi:hypothetical protein